MAKRWFHWVFEDGSEGVLDNNDRTDWDHGISTTEIQLAPLSAVVCEEGSRDWAVVQKMRGLRVANCHSPSSEYDTVHSIVNSLWLSGFLTLTDSPKPEAPKAESEETQREYGVKLAMGWAERVGQYGTAYGANVRTLMDEVKRLKAVVEKPCDNISKPPPADLLTKEERDYLNETVAKGICPRRLWELVDRLAPAPAWKPRTGEMVKWWRGQASGTAPFLCMNRDAVYPYLVSVDARMVQLAVERVDPLDAKDRDIRPAKEESHG